MRLHHVGVAVADLEPAIEMYTSLFGAELTHRASSEKDGLEAAFLQMGDAEIELLAPLRDDSAVASFSPSVGRACITSPTPSPISARPWPTRCRPAWSSSTPSRAWACTAR